MLLFGSVLLMEECANNWASGSEPYPCLLNFPNSCYIYLLASVASPPLSVQFENFRYIYLFIGLYIYIFQAVRHTVNVLHKAKYRSSVIFRVV